MLNYAEIHKPGKFVLIALLFWNITSLASAQIFIEQGKLNLDVSAGETVSGELNIHNTSDKKLTVRAYMEDFRYKPPFDGTKEFMASGVAADSASQFINYFPASFTLDPFAKQVISYTVNVPDNFDKGHYGVLFFQKEGEEIKSEKGLTIVTRVGTLFFVEPKQRKRAVELTQFQFNQNKITVNFKNTGNVILIPSSVYYVMDEGQLVVDRGFVKKIYLPPQESVKYGFEVDAGLAPGDYTIILTLDLEGGDVLVREIDFTKDPASNYKITTVRN